jgi:hypothetical protein
VRRVHRSAGNVFKSGRHRNKMSCSILHVLERFNEILRKAIRQTVTIIKVRSNKGMNDSLGCFSSEIRANPTNVTEMEKR